MVMHWQLLTAAIRGIWREHTSFLQTELCKGSIPLSYRSYPFLSHSAKNQKAEIGIFCYCFVAISVPESMWLLQARLKSKIADT